MLCTRPALPPAACSTAKGPDGKKGTADDTYVDPTALGFTGMCEDTFGQCGAIATSPLTQSGPDNDLIDCAACIMGTAADRFSAFCAPLYP